MQKFTVLEPKLIWKYFEKILQIPRASKKEEKILAFLEEFAREQQLPWKKDRIGNCTISKSAYAGCEDMKKVILQSHVDMVCEKNEAVQHNFATDPIQAYISDGWIKAEGTTLGADNGIGVAAQLAILADKTIQHGPLECLFTVDEESGLTGAFNIGDDLIDGKILINLDSEDEGELFIGCAGGINTIVTFPYKTKSIKHDCKAFTLKIRGLKGGHSGDDINKGRSNANKILARFLWNAYHQFQIGLFEIQGGNLHNAIPREANAGFTINSSKEKDMFEFIKDFEQILISEISVNEPDLVVEYLETPLPVEIMTNNSIQRLLNALHACPNGVIEMSEDISGLVKTSSNLASIKMKERNTIEIVTSQRSSVETLKQCVSDRIYSLFQLARCQITQTGSYPGWTPNTRSPILKITEKSYFNLFTVPPKIKAIHAGLECGLFLKKYPYLDMISFGPTIKGAHSPDERLEIESVKKFWALLIDVLKNIPKDT
jgi:dipeptidase D